MEPPSRSTDKKKKDMNDGGRGQATHSGQRNRASASGSSTFADIMPLDIWGDSSKGGGDFWDQHERATYGREDRFGGDDQDGPSGRDVVTPETAAQKRKERKRKLEANRAGHNRTAEKEEVILDKKLLKVIKNRENAARVRREKKEESKRLANEFETLKEQVTTLKSENDALKSKIGDLNDLLRLQASRHSKLSSKRHSTIR
mmetsp:Transcript_6711/g.20323  ORF Transcript_6711/g.20323 Transcript_6711/m.20323 type:complete len:202 (+) Transcript_6711:234-839(+)